mmetsp:Transcript_1023/g.1937  ORF Transcript_1023/g.1937 Transcript_1023/m.1937 type:complete len:146 (+) Transcript_1023:79-516(+)
MKFLPTSTLSRWIPFIVLFASFTQSHSRSLFANGKDLNLERRKEQGNTNKRALDFSSCNVSTKCEPCLDIEKGEDYCASTGHREILSCNESPETRYRSCGMRHSDGSAVLKFEAILAVVLAGAAFGMKYRKRKIMAMQYQRLNNL